MENVGQANVKVQLRQDNVAGVKLPVFVEVFPPFLSIVFNSMPSSLVSPQIHLFIVYCLLFFQLSLFSV